MVPIITEVYHLQTQEEASSAGIVSGGKITFTIPTGTYTNELHYYCVAHSSMVSANGLEIGQINSIAGWDGTPVKQIQHQM